MKDYKISLDDYLSNGGYSSKHFLEHFKYFIANMPEGVQMNMYRTKLILTNTKNSKTIIIQVHWNGKSNKYLTVLNKRKTTELATLRCNIPHETLRGVVLSILQV